MIDYRGEDFIENQAYTISIFICLIFKKDEFEKNVLKTYLFFSKVIIVLKT